MFSLFYYLVFILVSVCICVTYKVKEGTHVLCGPLNYRSCPQCLTIYLSVIFIHLFLDKFSYFQTQLTGCSMRFRRHSQFLHPGDPNYKDY